MKRDVGLVLAMGLVAFVVPECVPYSGQAQPLVGAPNNYKGAAIFAATGVGAAALHRKLSGGCYAVCSPGYYCDRSSGMCQKMDECHGPNGRDTCQGGPQFRLVRSDATAGGDSAEPKPPGEAGGGGEAGSG